MTERQRVEIDDCPTYRGVGLARSELDKIIEHPTAELAWAALTPLQQPGPMALPAGAEYGGHRPNCDDRHHRSHYRKSLRKELFD